MNAERRFGCFRSLSVILCIIAILPGDTLAYGFPQSSSPASSPSQAIRIPPEQLDSLVAPIALYPDQLLAQVLAASTYPLEIVQLHQWMLTKNLVVRMRSKFLWTKVDTRFGEPSLVKPRLALDTTVINHLENDGFRCGLVSPLAIA